MAASLLFLSIFFVCSFPLALVVGDSMPLPFYRELELTNPPMTGNDVYILQNLLRRTNTQPDVTSDYDADTVASVKAFQSSKQLSVDGIVGPETAQAVLDFLTYDGYKDNGSTAGSMGFKYKILLPVHRNRSIETNGTLFDADGNVLLSFRARAHGIDTGGAGPWPDFNNTNDGLNEFSTDGNTPTGLATIDLNAPEDEPEEYGPYPINRVVQGLEGNFAFLYPKIRTGILVHTGEWPGWVAPEDMPNSEGCVHSWPVCIDDIYKLLTSIGVAMRPNSPQIPYPYPPQGLISVFSIDE